MTDVVLGCGAYAVQRSGTSGSSATAAARTAAMAAAGSGETLGSLGMGSETSWQGNTTSNTPLATEFVFWLSQDQIDAATGVPGSTVILGNTTSVFGFSADAKIYRVDEADYTISSGAPTLRWYTPSELAGYTVLASYTGTNDPMGTFPVTFDSGGFAVWVLVLDSIASGGGWAFDSGPAKQRFLQDDPWLVAGGTAEIPSAVATGAEPAWRLYWKNGTDLELRIGPHHNPDGGLCYFTTAAGVVYQQGDIGAGTGLGSYDYQPDSWTFHDHTDGAWEDDGATSLDTDSDGLSVRYVRPAELDVDDANHVAYCDVIYAPPDPPVPGAVATGARVVRRRPQPTSGTVNVEFMDSTGTTVYASETGSTSFIFTSDPAEIADVAANGCIQRLHAGDVAEITEWEQAWLSVSWSSPGTIPVTFKSADGTEQVTLPMHQVYP